MRFYLGFSIFFFLQLMVPTVYVKNSPNFVCIALEKYQEAFSFLQIGFNGSHILWSKVRRILVRVTKYLHCYNSFSVSDGML